MAGAGLYREVARVLSDHLRQEVEVTPGRGLGGGCINNAECVTTSAGRFFLKSNPSPLPGMFPREAEGLQALASVGAIAVPEPIHASDGGEDFPPFLLTTYIEPGRKGPEFFQEFGRAFARLHREGTGERFGFDRDNYIGATPQPNKWCEDWVEFFREHRLGFQLKLARRNGHGGELQRLGDKLLGRLGEYLAAPDEPPTILHGDLWGGNYMVGAEGAPVLIDPAAYYGRREADLAMTRLFGGFDRDFYAAYEEAWPLADGSEARLEIYELYHLLNHLNLFGGGYLGGCLGILRRFA
ncbi:MAG: fructosamine kinase family protein [Candidatus Sumerlaeia bacterium]|nr:fructosamine kinase family protein [Candidatus Sumerlaeia bacterium]